MRLIDSDFLKEHIKKYTSVFAKYDWREICEMLNDAPTVDAVPVVRCKDCVYFWDGVCTAHTDAICTDENEFCSWGERREDDTVRTV